MRRADVLWMWNGSAFSDITYALGEQYSGGVETHVSATLAAGQTLYVGHSDWMSGLLFMIDTPPTARPNLEIEMYDGQSDSWKPLPREERIDQLDFGHYVDTRGYTFQTHGVVYWGTAPWLWTLRTPTTSFPEAGTPP